MHARAHMDICVHMHADTRTPARMPTGSRVHCTWLSLRHVTTRVHRHPIDHVCLQNAELLLQLLSADEPLSGPASHAHGRAKSKSKNKNHTHARAAFGIAKDEHGRSASGGVAGARAAANAQCKGPIQRRVSSSGGRSKTEHFALGLMFWRMSVTAVSSSTRPARALSLTQSLAI